MAMYVGNQKVCPVIKSGITPSGKLSITENGTYDVTNYASANVDVSGGAGNSVTLYFRAFPDNLNVIAFTTTPLPQVGDTLYICPTQEAIEMGLDSETMYDEIFDAVDGNIEATFGSFIPTELDNDDASITITT